MQKLHNHYPTLHYALPILLHQWPQKHYHIKQGKKLLVRFQGLAVLMYVIVRVRVLCNFCKCFFNLIFNQDCHTKQCRMLKKGMLNGYGNVIDIESNHVVVLMNVTKMLSTKTKVFQATRITLTNLEILQMAKTPIMKKLS